MCMAALNGTVIADLQREQYRSTPTLDETHRQACTDRRSGACHDFPGWQLSGDAVDQHTSLVQLVETHGHTRSDVAFVADTLRNCKLIVRWPRLIDAQVEGLAAGTPGKTGEAKPLRELRGYLPSAHKAIAQSRMFFVDLSQLVGAAGDLTRKRSELSQARRFDIFRDPAGHQPIE